MADLAETKKAKTSILGDIQRHMLAKIDQPSDRRQDILHPSEMAKSDWCPRQSWYRLSGAEPSNPEKKHGHQLENIFDEGHTIHDKWQRRLWDMGRLWGKWRCLSCRAEWEATAPERCEKCDAGKDLLQYREVPIDGEEKYLIAGHEDGAVLDVNALIEIKSIGQGTLRLEEPGLLRDHLKETVDGKKIYDLDGIWKSLKRPLNSHIRQTSIYIALAIEAGVPVDKIIFLYEYKSNQQVKEFTIRYTPRIAEPLLDSARDIKWALETGREVPRPGDRDRDHKSCKECPFYTTCMGATDGTSGPTDVEPAESSSDPRPERELGSGRPRRQGRRTAVGSGDRPAGASRRGRTAPAEGPDRSGRLSPDEPVRDADRVGGVSGSATRSSGGRRVVRRRRSEADREPVGSA